MRNGAHPAEEPPLRRPRFPSRSDANTSLGLLLTIKHLGLLLVHTSFDGNRELPVKGILIWQNRNFILRTSRLLQENNTVIKRCLQGNYFFRNIGAIFSGIPFPFSAFWVDLCLSLDYDYAWQWQTWPASDSELLKTEFKVRWTISLGYFDFLFSARVQLSLISYWC